MTGFKTGKATITRDSKEPVIAHVVFNLTSKSLYKMGAVTYIFESGPIKDNFSFNF